VTSSAALIGKIAASSCVFPRFLALASAASTGFRGHFTRSKKIAASAEWPKTSGKLGSKLRRLAPQLRLHGMSISFGRRNDRRTITLTSGGLRGVRPGGVAVSGGFAVSDLVSCYIGSSCLVIGSVGGQEKCVVDRAVAAILRSFVTR
jgi:hypothetical protein